MKKVIYLLILVLTFNVNLVTAQDINADTSKFSIGFTLSEQFVGKDSGENIEGSFGYAINTNMSLYLTAANATMRSNTLDINYNLDKYAVQVAYDFLKSENTKLESIFGLSYLSFDDEILEDDNNGLGVDLGVQTTFNSGGSFNYGLRIVSTYSSFSPGGILNAGINFTYRI
ncbi:outer membrane beta-barrel protein [Winogradskyella arenosi]|uniref:Outer membrane protein with beta-barrel domain n=1 Tax=Winogradskyella arenosi TaxID=533325 RepID=A0A368ZH26_9FLAO|nr:outer membrane beta-barrel protein [Winogradskyella arenosi]RCW92782.1 outer membrane protein with beta-barrel domain [Winogradskyella arenosi]